ncbi:MAG: hypothetical protein VZS44_07760 [Bacilli bacterium]|nr:hypothetical protein [Bacilli bacterium]
MSKYPDYNFPADVESIPVLLVNKYETLKDGNLWGRYVNENGKEVFIVDRRHIRNFADYLSIRKIIDSGALE